MLKRFKKLFKNRKRGMSLVVVIVSTAMLVVMGTLFTSVALRSFNYSYSQLCKQQAYYTAESSVKALYDLIYSDTESLSTIKDALIAKVQAQQVLDPDVDVTSIYCTVGEIGGSGTIAVGDAGPSIIEDSGIFKDVMGTCKVRVRFLNEKQNQMSLEATATYKGYTESVRMRIAEANPGAEEIAKIFSNAFYWSSPLTCLVAAETTGNVHIAQPVVYASADDVSNAASVYNTVLQSLEVSGYYNGYAGTAGQYIRNADGEIINSPDSNPVVVYNKYLRDHVYGNIDFKIAEGESQRVVYGHTKPFDINNEPLAVEGQTLRSDSPYSGASGSVTSAFQGEWYDNASEIIYYNDWVELYMFSDYRSTGYGDIRSSDFDYTGDGATMGGNSLPQDYLSGDITYPRNYTAINGDLYVESRALIGLWDKDAGDKKNWQFYRDGAYARDYWDYYTDPETDEPGVFESYVEHGFGTDVFFDHDNGKIPAESTTFRINGDMYLWEDTRIENFDSINTYNAYQGIKNNIYANKNLTIDGYIYQSGQGIYRVHKDSVSVFGDIMVQGDLYIANSTIYGDIYCNGDSLTILDSTIYGNVYFRGNDFVMDYSAITSGTLRFKDGGGLTQNCPGGNLVIAGLNADCETPSTDETNNYNNENSIGANINNSSVMSSLYSGVNTKIWVTLGESTDYYGNVFCDGFLEFNLKYESHNYKNIWLYGSEEAEDDTWFAIKNNKIDVNGTIFTKKLQILQSQWWATSEATYIYFDNIYTTSGNKIEGKYGLVKGNTIKAGTIYNGGQVNILTGVDFSVELNPSIIGTWLGGFGFSTGYTGTNFDGANDYVFAHMNEKFATFVGPEAIHFESDQRLNLWADYFFPTIWEEKKITPQEWTAPKALLTETELGEGIYYHKIPQSVDIMSAIDIYNRPDVMTIDRVNKVIEFKKSAEFDFRVSFNGYTVKFNSYEDNIHLKFNKGVDFGNNVDVILTGGNMTFVYVFGGDGVASPELTFGSNCNIGIIEEMVGVDYRADSIYFISNDDITIRMGRNMNLQGYIYAPKAYADVLGADSAENGRNILDGCMAVHNHIMNADLEEQTGDPENPDYDKPDKDENTENAERADYSTYIERYRYSVYNHVTAPIITDTDIVYGDFGQMGEKVWLFLGYY